MRPPSLGRIDQYELVRKLGGGGFGVVYLARDTISGVEVALKTLHPLMKSNAEEMERLREKFALVSRLSHPNIASALVLHPVREVSISDAAVWRELRLSPGDSVMVMRYAPGITLSQWRRQFRGGPTSVLAAGGASSGRGRSPGEPTVPLPLAFEIGRQIASALDYAHSERIVHRDIKPANVMVETLSPPSRVESLKLKVESSGATNQPANLQPFNPSTLQPADAHLRVRLLDFGLAAEIRSSMSRVSSETGDTSGTRPYMAPEQWLGKKQDGRTDQYALACVLYELLSGAPPFAGVFETGDPAIMERAVTARTPEEIDDIPPAVNAALQKALAKNPKERFSSCAEFVASLSGEAEKGGARRPGKPHGRSLGGPDSGRGRPPGGPDSPVSEANVLRRKVALSRRLAAVAAADRDDAQLCALVSEADTELTAAEEALKYTRFVAAAECLDRAENALDQFDGIKMQRSEEAARKTREVASRKAHEAEARRKREETEWRVPKKAERITQGEVAPRRIVEPPPLDASSGAQWISTNPPHGKAGQKPQNFWTLRKSVLVIWAIPAFTFLGVYIRQLLWKHSSWHTIFGHLESEWWNYVPLGVGPVMIFVLWARLFVIECRGRKETPQSRHMLLVMLAFGLVACFFAIVLFANSRAL